MKKILSILFIAIIGIASWYLFLKPGDYTAKIKAKTTVGTVNQTIKMWNRLSERQITIAQDGQNNLTQQLVFNDTTHIYNWKLSRVNDSLTEVTVDIKDSNAGVLDRVKNLFSETAFEKRSKKTVLNFYELLESHLERIKITIDGTTTLPAKEYAYTSYNGPQTTKANGMMRDLGYLENALLNNKVVLDGLPFINITTWDITRDSIAYQFALPIIRKDSLPIVKGIKYDSRPEQKVIKATYNGNYITSDRAWYALLDYAKSNNIKVDPRPIEVFYNNPNMGGDELRWKAEIFLPIIK